MALLKWELKKIWRPSLLLAIALIGLVFYDARPGFYLEHFWNASNLRLSAGWLEAYGTTMEPEERAQLDGQLEELEAEFAEQVAQISGAAEAGITDYESYLDWEENYHNSTRAETRTEEDSDLSWAIYYTTNLNIVESLIQFMENYDTLAAGEAPEFWGGEVGEYSPAHQPSIRRVEEVRAAGVCGFLPSAAINSADNFFHYFAFWCVFSAVLLLSPTSGAGRPPPHQSHAVDFPPGTGGAERPDGGGPAVRGAAHSAQLRRLSGPLPGNRRPAVLGLLPGQCMER